MYLHYGKIPIPVLFENDSCFVFDKPAGLAVQGGEGIKVSLDSILSENIPSRPHLVHRLDRDTSGVILVAKTKEAAAGFSLLFSGHKNPGKNNFHAAKQYLGICNGVPNPEQGVIRLSLDIRGQEKESETFYKKLKSGTSGEMTFSLLELELGTGRMHQIRRHLALNGNPLLGDDKYGDFPLNKKLRQNLGLKNLLLHASRLVISPFPELLPEGLDVQAPLPPYFSTFLTVLNLNPR